MQATSPRHAAPLPNLQWSSVDQWLCTQAMQVASNCFGGVLAQIPDGPGQLPEQYKHSLLNEVSGHAPG